jgi:site-specific DNA-methyltransferase (adenine-specific)
MKGAKREVIGNYVDPSGRERNYDGRLVTSLSHGDFVINQKITIPSTPEAKQWHGWKTSLKPAYEPIILVRKPISERNIALNVLKWGTGGLNIDQTRIKSEITSEQIKKKYTGNIKKRITYKLGMDKVKMVDDSPLKGRYPSNVILDEDAGQMLDEQSGFSISTDAIRHNHQSKTSGKGIYGKYNDKDGGGYSDKGGASRFFYCSKVSPTERGKLNRHPTVKPIKLIEYLVKLITPPNGTVLDPFVGSGTTLKACQNLGFNGLGFELDKSNEPVIRKRCHLDSNLAKYLG